MIHIEKDSVIFGNENLRVESPTGDYEDTALIEFYDVNDPKRIAGSFQAQCVKYGNIVYQFNDPRELGAEILKIDPESTHSAASFVRMNAELMQQLMNGNLEPDSLSEMMVSEKTKMEDQMIEPVKVKVEEPVKPKKKLDQPRATSTIPVIDTPIVTSTTSPDTIPSTTAPSDQFDQDIPGDTLDSVDTLDTVTPATPNTLDMGGILEKTIDIVSPEIKEIKDVVSSVSRKFKRIAKRTTKPIKKRRT